jgi:hypothetical protein
MGTTMELTKTSVAKADLMNGASRRLAGAMVGTQPRFEVVTITPEMAARWLEKNTANNRNVNGPTVDVYARDMRAGRWQLTPQGVAFNRTGELVDGQHRLHAIIKAGVAVEMVVATGFLVEYDSPLDQGRVRSFGAILHRDNRWVSLVRGLLFLEAGGVGKNVRKASLGEITEAFERHREAVEMLWPEYRKLPGGMLSAMAWALPLDHGKVASFAAQVRDGELIERGDPAFALRTWLERNSRASGHDHIFATCSAMRALLQGETITAIHTGQTGYRWLTMRRRAERIPHTPAPAIVPAPGDDAPARAKTRQARSA